MGGRPGRVTVRVGWRRYARLVAFERITVDPDTMGGMPTIRGLRIPVATVVAMVADGMSVAEIIDELPDLTPEDVADALRYAAEAMRERELPLRHSA
jgi:uncharacterized protein (DUF433 family)